MQICTETGKDRYPAKSDAVVAASRIERPPKRKGGRAWPYKLRAYKCSMCGDWHLTKRERRPR